MRLLRLALRNLTRNLRRTLVTGLAIAFGVAAIVLLQGFVNGFVRTQVEGTVLGRVGAVQVFKKGYLGADDPLSLTMAEDASLVAKMEAVPGVAAVAPRLEFDGMLSNGSEGTMFMAIAIDPAREYLVCPRRKTERAPGTEPLEPQDTQGALIGMTLAESLGAKKGATLVMQAAGAHASTNALDVTVQGFLPSRNVMESKRLATTSLAFAQELLRMPGRVTEYVVGVRDLAQVDQVAAGLRAVLGDGYQVTTWRDMDPNTRDRVKTIPFVLLFVTVVLFLLVATGIINTMMMSVFERVREIGTMLAVGVRRHQVRTLFLWEASALGLSSGLAGALLGALALRGLARHGIPLKQPGGEPFILRPGVSVQFLALVVGFAVLGTVVAALYPAWKASRLQPVDALRAN